MAKETNDSNAVQVLGWSVVLPLLIVLIALA